MSWGYTHISHYGLSHTGSYLLCRSHTFTLFHNNFCVCVVFCYFWLSNDFSLLFRNDPVREVHECSLNWRTNWMQSPLFLPGLPHPYVQRSSDSSAGNIGSHTLHTNGACTLTQSLSASRSLGHVDVLRDSQELGLSGFDLTMLTVGLYVLRLQNRIVMWLKWCFLCYHWSNISLTNTLQIKQCRVLCLFLLF